MGVSQIEDIHLRLKKKRILHSKFKRQFKNLDYVEIMEESSDSFSNYWLITMRINCENPELLRENVLKQSHLNKVYLRPSWKLLNELPMFETSPHGDLSEAINQSKRLINLPSSPQLVMD